MKPLNLCVAALLGALLAGCGGGSEIMPDRSLDDHLQADRQVLDTLRQHPLAAEQAGELQRAEMWLSRVELVRQTDDASPERLSLLLDTAEGQLIRVKATLARLSAERELAARRERYETEMTRLRASREESKRLDGAEEAP